jgi:beta-phosphoglucomutase-like phosphatase (HAD superfamily)
MLTKARVKEIIRLKDEFFAGAPEPPLFPGAIDVVSAFAQKGFKVGVVTGGNRPEFERLIPSEIKEATAVSICGDEVMYGKPNPEPYLKAIMALGVKPQKTAVIENAPYGIEAARGAGAFVVAVRSYLSDKDLSGAHEMIDDIRELPSLFGLM